MVGQERVTVEEERQSRVCSENKSSGDFHLPPSEARWGDGDVEMRHGKDWPVG